MQMEISKTFTFEAAHVLPKHPGKCSNLHGHSWKLRVYVKGEVNTDTGFVMDYVDIKTPVEQQIISELDHKCLGDWTAKLFMSPDGVDYAPLEKHCVHGMPFDFYPSSENLLIWIGKMLCNPSSRMRGIGLGLNWSKLELDETCTSSCILTREDYEKQAR